MVWTTADSVDQDDATKKKQLLNVPKSLLLPGRDDSAETFGPGQKNPQLELGKAERHVTFSEKKDDLETSGDVSTLHMLQRLVLSVLGSLLRCCEQGLPLQTTFSGVHGAEGDETNTKLLRHGQKQDQSVERRPETGQVHFQQGFGGAHSHLRLFQREDDVSCIGGVFHSLCMVFAGCGCPWAVTEDDVEEKQLLVERDDVPYAHVRVLIERERVHSTEFSIAGDGVAHHSTDACAYPPGYMTMVLHSVANAGDEEHDQGHASVLNKKGHVGTGDVSTNEDGVPPVSAGPLDTVVLPPDQLSKDSDGEVGDVDIAGGGNAEEEDEGGHEDGHEEVDDDGHEDKEEDEEEEEEEEEEVDDDEHEEEDEEEADDDEHEEEEEEDDDAVEETVNLGSAGNPIVVGNLSSSDFEAIIFYLCPLLP